MKGTRFNTGVGESLTYRVQTPLDHQSWQTFRVIAKGDLIETLLDGTKLFEVTNNILQQPGKVGLWTKAVAVTQFDDFTIKSLD